MLLPAEPSVRIACEAPSRSVPSMAKMPATLLAARSCLKPDVATAGCEFETIGFSALIFGYLALTSAAKPFKRAASVDVVMELTPIATMHFEAEVQCLA